MTKHNSKVTFDLAKLGPIAVALGLGLMLSATAARAEKADQDKPTNIAADHTESDDLHQIDIFTGNVILTKGTIILRSAKLLVHQDPEGYQSGVATWDGKTPVYFKQKREGFADQFMEGNAERIEYDEKTNTVKLFDHAIVKRLEGVKDADEARGDTITYNSDTEKYLVNSGKTQERTYTVLQPKNVAPAAGTPTGAATPAKAGIETSPQSAGGASAPAISSPSNGTVATGAADAASTLSTPAKPLQPAKSSTPPIQLAPADTLTTVPQ